MNDNLEPGSLQPFAAGEPHTAEVLNAFFVDTEKQAREAIHWYFDHKKWKARFSRAIQLLAIALTALGGIFPVACLLLKNIGVWPNAPETGLWSALFVGIAAFLLGLDRAFGFSSGWARYVLTATTIRKALEEFRMDWALLRAQVNANPSLEQVAGLLQCAKTFRVIVEASVLEETRTWASEFQNNVAQLEKEINVQLSALKAQADKRLLAANEPGGALDLTVINADRCDHFAFEVVLEGERGKPIREEVSDSKKWTKLGLDPGQHSLRVKALATGKPTATSEVVIIRSSEVTKIEVSLPI